LAALSAGTTGVVTCGGGNAVRKLRTAPVLVPPGLAYRFARVERVAEHPRRVELLDV
jgi:hypothetical protein